MINKKLEADLNEQINKEFYSAYLYLAMAAHFDSVNLPGFAQWMKKQAAEEQSHAMKIYGYLYDVGSKVSLKAIEVPPHQFGSPKDIFELVLEHEQKVTQSIKALYEQAQKDNDPASAIFLQWFISEQVEEEKTARDLLEQLKMSGDQPFAIMFMDKNIASVS